MGPVSRIRGSNSSFSCIPCGVLRPVESDRVGACQARSVQYKTGYTSRERPTAQPANHPASQADGRAGGHPAWQGPHHPRPCVPGSRTWPHSYSHPPTPTPRLINHVTCTGSYYSTKLVAAGAVVPLQISHRPQIRFFQCLTCPQLLRFARPPAQQTDDETSPHWHRTVGCCSGAPRKLVEPPNESAVDARLAPSLTNLFMRLRRPRPLFATASFPFPSGCSPTEPAWSWSPAGRLWWLRVRQDRMMAMARPSAQ